MTRDEETKFWGRLIDNLDNLSGILNKTNEALIRLSDKVDVMAQEQGEIKQDIKDVKEQTTKTNGRVSRLETWKEDLIRMGSISMIFIGIIGGLIVYIYIEDKKELSKNIAIELRKQLDQTEIIIK
jgi:hypothetical protein